MPDITGLTCQRRRARTSPAAARDEVCGRGAGVPVASISASDAAERFAFLGAFVGVDNLTSSEVTRKVLGWEPAHPGLIEDLEHGHYFEPG